MNCPNCKIKMEGENRSTNEPAMVGLEDKIQTIKIQYYCRCCQTYWNWTPEDGLVEQETGIK